MVWHGLFLCLVGLLAGRRHLDLEFMKILKHASRLEMLCIVGLKVIIPSSFFAFSFSRSLWGIGDRPLVLSGAFDGWKLGVRDLIIISMVWVHSLGSLQFLSLSLAHLWHGHSFKSWCRLIWLFMLSLSIIWSMSL